jgi:hypothetical protein
MGFFDNLKSMFLPPADPNAMWLYVKCKRCGTPLAVRVDLRNELSADYESGGYVLYKEMMDSQCFTLMRAEIRFDAKRNIVEQKIDKGEFITKEMYDIIQDEKQAKHD